MVAARLLAVALLGLGLSGCWYGQGLFADSDARVILAPGIYRLTEPAKSAHDVTISVLPSGMTKLNDPESDDGDAAYGFAAVPGKSGRFLGWFAKADKPSPMMTAKEPSTSEAKCKASAARAWLLVSRAARWRAFARQKLTPISINKTAKGINDKVGGTAPSRRWL